MSTVPVKRKIAAGLAASAGVLFLLALFVLPWWQAAEIGSIDLLGFELCLNGNCRSQSLAQASGSAMWSRLGALAFACGLASAVLLAAVAALSLIQPATSTRTSALAWVTATMSVFGGLMGVGFWLVRPEFGELAPGYGLASFLSAASLGGLSASVLARRS